MAVVADTFTISAVVLCIVGAVCFYLFTRLKQVEKKVALMEGILLDLKTAAQHGFLGFPPAPDSGVEEADEDEDEEAEVEAEAFIPKIPEGEVAEVVAAATEETPQPTKTISVPKFDDSTEMETASVQTIQVNKMEGAGGSSPLESLSVAELTTMAKERGITGVNKMRKSQLVAALSEPDAINANSSLISSSSLMASPL